MTQRPSILCDDIAQMCFGKKLTNAWMGVVLRQRVATALFMKTSHAQSSQRMRRLRCHGGCTGTHTEKTKNVSEVGDDRLVLTINARTHNVEVCAQYTNIGFE